MKIFISHSLEDKDLIQKVVETLKPYNIDLLIAEHSYETRETITKKIEKMITDCDLALILLTEKGFNSAFVQQEIGYITSLKKPHIQLVQFGFEKKISGFNFGKDFILFDPKKPELAIEKSKKNILAIMKDKTDLEKRTAQIKIRKELQKRQEVLNNQKIGIGILVAVIAVALLFSD